jgi:hypothetical protein
MDLTAMRSLDSVVRPEEPSCHIDPNTSRYICGFGCLHESLAMWLRIDPKWATFGRDSVGDGGPKSGRRGAPPSRKRGVQDWWCGTTTRKSTLVVLLGRETFMLMATCVEGLGTDQGSIARPRLGSSGELGRDAAGGAWSKPRSQGGSRSPSTYPSTRREGTDQGRAGRGPRGEPAEAPIKPNQTESNQIKPAGGEC